jgi:hypothetical protein
MSNPCWYKCSNSASVRLEFDMFLMNVNIQFPPRENLLQVPGLIPAILRPEIFKAGNTPLANYSNFFRKNYAIPVNGAS